MKTNVDEVNRASRASEIMRSFSSTKNKAQNQEAVRPATHEDNFKKEIEEINQRKMVLDSTGVANPYFRVSDSVSTNSISISGTDYINFSGFNYLGFSGDDRVNQAAKDAIDKFGTSPSASRLVAGEQAIHVELETELAQFLDCEASIVLPSGHSTNVTVVGHLFDKDDIILYDELSHNSLIEGAVLSGARRVSFKHNDVAHCESYINKLGHLHKRIVIIVEGVYSMDGDISPIDAFVALKRKYGAILYIDEAHSLGTIGATGGGILEHYNLKGEDIDLWMGTLSKSLASNGGYIAGKKDIIEYIKYTTPGFVFSTGITPSNTAAALTSLRLLKGETQRFEQLNKNSAHFSEKLVAAGFDVGLSKGTPIIPLIIGDSSKAILLSDGLFKEGIISHPLFYPTVAENEARLRFFITSEHTTEQLDYVVEKITSCMAKLA